MSTKTDHRPDDSPPAYGSAARTEEEAEQMVQSYASEHCAENTGHCRGCGHRQSAAFFGRPDEDDWCYLAEGNLRESSVEMCPALSPQNDNKLSDRSPETPVESTAAQGEGADSARAKAEAESVTEPDKLGAEASKLNARAAVRCSAWLGVRVFATGSLDNWKLSRPTTMRTAAWGTRRRCWKG